MAGDFLHPENVLALEHTARRVHDRRLGHEAVPVRRLAVYAAASSDATVFPLTN